MEVKRTQVTVAVVFVGLSSRALNHVWIAQELTLGSGKGLSRHIVNYFTGRVAFDWRALNLSRRCGDLSRSCFAASRFIVASHRTMSVLVVVNQQTGHQKDWWAWSQSDCSYDDVCGYLLFDSN